MPSHDIGPKLDIKKEVKYLNKDFAGFRNDLIEFAKTYFPNSYTDFNESSPGMLFIELASYVGDVLSYYMDNQFKESILAYAEETQTIYDIAQSLGYKPKITFPSFATLDVFQTVPAQGSADNTTPNMNYALTVKGNSRVRSESTGKTFRFLDDVNFKFSSSFDPTTVSIFETDSNVQFNNVTVDGDLVVNGTQTLNNTTNLLIEDRFILMNSGSSATGDGGILVGSGSAFSASAFIFDDSEDRWGVQIDTQLGSSAATSAPEAYASLYVLTANTGSATYAVKGNIKIDDGTGDIFIYS